MASANSAMGLALATFDWPMWLIYVAFTVAAETYLAKKWLEVKWLLAVRATLTANFLSAVLGVMCSGPFGYSMFLGTEIEPNPFGNILVQFFFFAMVSAFFEFLVWRTMFSSERLFGSLVAIHAVTTPFGLAILLTPERPYPGLEGRTAFHRNLQKAVQPLNAYVSEFGTLPSASNAEAALRSLIPFVANDRLKAQDRQPLWPLAYEPAFRRFDTRESRQQSRLWNSELAGKKISELPEGETWLIRSPGQGQVLYVVRAGETVSFKREWTR